MSKADDRRLRELADDYADATSKSERARITKQMMKIIKKYPGTERGM